MKNDRFRLPSALSISRYLATFLAGVACGAIVIPMVHWVVYGQIDPFQHGWPFCLQASAFGLSLLIAYVFRCTTAAPLGLYAGVVGLMLASGQAEYPVSSVIGLLLHAFLPAALGSLAALVVLQAQRHSWQPAKS